MGDEVAGSDRGRVEELLLGWGADRLAHPGGTLYEHLRRVASLLEAWSADPAVLMAGLCHACYGTDGYDQALLGVDDRAILVELIGWRAESLVYLYSSCDRASVYPRLAGSDPVPFRDRFTGRTVVPTEPDLRGFLEITAANELDVVAHNPAMAAEHGAGLLRLFTRSRERLSDAAWRACVQALGPHRPGRHDEPAPIEVARLDHVVLTVTDQQRTVEFYRRVLGMQPVTFGQGRRALAFGSSKINLHQAGREFTPHAAKPAPGSADICLVSTTPIDQVLAHLRLQRVDVEEGPVPRTGALGPMESVYIRDPDGNLIEIASYGPQRRGRDLRECAKQGYGTHLLRRGGGLRARAARELPLEGLGEWWEAVARHLAPRPGMRLVDLGAGTCGPPPSPSGSASRSSSSNPPRRCAPISPCPHGGRRRRTPSRWRAANLRREAHTPAAAHGAEYQAGLARLHAAARIQTGPLDMLVLRKPVLPGRKRDGGLHTGGHYPELGGTA